MNKKELAKALGHNDKYLINRYIEEGTIIVTKSTGWRHFEFAEGYNADLCKKHHEKLIAKHRSESMKTKWTDAVFTAKIRESQSKHSKEMWQNKDYRNKVISNVKAAWTEEHKETYSKEVKEKLAKPEIKEKMTQANRSNWSKQERHEKQSSAMKQYYQNEANREKTSIATKQAMTDALKAKISVKTKEGQQASNACEKISKASIEMWKNPEHGNRVHESLKRNGSYGHSYDHKRSLEWLKSKGLTIEQEKQYPTEPTLHCDAYIKEFDLWMEFHYYWGHGKEPFDSSNPKHLAIVKEWQKHSNENKLKYNISKTKFDACIKTWTYDDIRRRKDAETNNLNWHTPFSYDEFKQFFSKLAYKDIILYPWDNYLKAIDFTKERAKISGHDCIIKEVDSTLAKDFLDNYHYQGSLRTTSDVRIGLFYENELVSLATFGKPRYNQNYQWEALRYCVKSGMAIFGGAIKLYKYFEEMYKPQSIVSYQDLSKFKGNFHEKLNYTLLSESKSKHWYNFDTKIHLTDNLVRQRGVDSLLGTSFGKPEQCGMNNEQILRKLGYLEIYDEGQRTYVKVLQNASF